MVAPNIVSQDVLNFAASSYTISVPESSGPTLILFVMSGGANPVPSARPSSISGLGLQWSELGGGTSVNSRISGSAWSASGGELSGELTLTFPSEQTRISYYLVSTERDQVQSVSSETGASTVQSSFPSTPGGSSGVLSAVSVNAATLQPVGGEGQELVSDSVQFSSPTGRMFLYWQETATSGQSFTTSGTISKILVSTELRDTPEPEGARAYLVVGGQEVPVSVGLVEAGAERPVTLEHVGS